MASSGTGDYGTASGTGTIVYTDGTTQPFTLSFADWWANTATPGGDILATMPYINAATGRNNQRSQRVLRLGDRCSRARRCST